MTTVMPVLFAVQRSMISSQLSSVVAQFDVIVFALH